MSLRLHQSAVSRTAEASSESELGSGSKHHFRITYAIQNVGIDFSQESGDIIPVKYTLRGLVDRAHQVRCLKLEGLRVSEITDSSSWEAESDISGGLSGSYFFQLFERGWRRLQQKLNIPYLALFDSLRFYEACLRVTKDSDLIHEHNGLFSVGTALACLRSKTPYVLTVSADPIMEREALGIPLKGLQKWVGTGFSKLTYRLADRILCVSEAAREHLIQDCGIAPRKLQVMANGVDVEEFSPPRTENFYSRKKLGLNGGPAVGFVGSFHQWHGLLDLVEIFSQVHSVLPAVRLILVGDGPARGLVEEKIDDLGLRDFISITGIVPHERIPGLLSVMDVATLPYPPLSRRLWFSPLKLYEYMAAGKAIVATDAGQISEVISDGESGVLIPPGNKAAFARAIIRLMQDPRARKRLGDTARLQATKEHSWNQYVSKLEKTYVDVLNGREANCDD